MKGYIIERILLVIGWALMAFAFYYKGILPVVPAILAGGIMTLIVMGMSGMGIKNK